MFEASGAVCLDRRNAYFCQPNQGLFKMKRPSPQKRLLARLLIFAALLAVAWFVWHRQQQTQQTSQTPRPNKTEATGTQHSNKAPAYVTDVLQFIRRNGHAPEGYVGGREFQNREKRLPAKDSEGKRIRYSEWDVQPKMKGQNRGPERLVTGSDHSAYYTQDHYKTFLKID